MKKSILSFVFVLVLATVASAAPRFGIIGEQDRGMGAFITDENYWVGGEGAYISHNDNSNDVRNWTFQWAAPTEGVGDAVFIIYFNAVNGQGTNGDQWGYLTAVSLGTPQATTHESSIHEMGVSIMQYWIALIAIAVVFLSVFISYIVIRGGSSNYRG